MTPLTIVLDPMADKGSLHRLSQRNVVPLDPLRGAEGQDCVTGQFRAVVSDDHRPTPSAAWPSIPSCRQTWPSSCRKRLPTCHASTRIRARRARLVVSQDADNLLVGESRSLHCPVIPHFEWGPAVELMRLLSVSWRGSCRRSPCWVAGCSMSRSIQLRRTLINNQRWRKNPVAGHSLSATSFEVLGFFIISVSQAIR